MHEFFDNYFNVKKMIEEKREYKQAMARVKQLPEDYQYVFKKIQEYMWKFTSGAGYDILEIHYGVLELFEQGAIEGKHILDITGDDVAEFCEELLRSAATYTMNWRTDLNKDIHRHLKK